MAARKDVYNRAEVMQTICDLVARKQTLNQITHLPGMPSYETVRQWMLEDKELADNYARARALRADARADRIDEITTMIINGELDPQAARVIIDAEKWLAGKEQPKKYGDKIFQEHSGSVNVTTLTDEELIALAESTD
jgi:hypothetical protein